MFEIIVTSHGPLASAMKESLGFFFPECNVQTVEIDKDGIESFQNKMQELLKGFQGREILIFTDLLHGTPFNVAAKSVSEYASEYEILAGVNMPSLVEAVNLQKQGIALQEALVKIMDVSSIQSFKALVNARNNVDDE